MKNLLTLLLLFAVLTVNAQTAALEYIDKYKNLAIKHMNEQGVPASVILGISMHESANGGSKIARYLNNHFGIKGKNDSKAIKSAYRGYESVSDSYHDFVGAMKRNKKFDRLFGKYSSYDYYNWVLGIQNGGYAASRAWASQVIAIIKKYRLYEYDNRPAAASGDTSLIAQAVLTGVKQIEQAVVYRVKKGDTLSGIAKKFKTNVTTLMSRNSLRSSRLSVGQKLVL